MGIKEIDLVVVNLYPFEEIVSKGEKSIEKLIEMIDIGGPTMLRASAKNFEYVCPVCSPKYYEQIMEEMSSKGIKRDTRLRLAKEVFQMTSYYDALIARTLFYEKQIFPDKTAIPVSKEFELRYGENPHQKASYYSIPGSKEEKVSDFFTIGKLHGKELSYNNIQDISAALRILGDLEEKSCVVIKHTNPCGAGSLGNIYDSFMAAYEGDKVSIFGGIVGFKGNLDKKTAEAMSDIFLEIVIARSFDKDAFDILSKKKNIRLMEYQKWENLFLKKINSLMQKEPLTASLCRQKTTLMHTRKILSALQKKNPAKKKWKI